jgi:hypothetical protein
VSLPILYLAGPMTGLPDYNHPAFHKAAQQLRQAGYQVISPAENGLDQDAPWLRHMRRDIAMMMDAAEAIATLPDFGSSRGARIETALAHRLGWRVESVRTWLTEASALALEAQEGGL